MKTYTLDQIYDAAFSLLETGAPSQRIDIENEYARGVCELIGRLRLEAAEHLNERFRNRGKG